ncbi:jg8372 [Pararge aegeria aegeria]|uniref:Jg8372 protein n=1 Tax=Pararge aegeria aegeria TaxID=348720 RepID=A0A8S4SFZ9_9NEOP|nr:jg8372 [Pararge aegeria aegeria]
MTKSRWRCLTHCTKGCRATIYTIGNTIQYAVGRRGNRLLKFEEFYYSIHRTKNIGSSLRIRWRCCLHNSKGFPVPIFIEGKRGRKLLRVGYHTYTLHLMKHTHGIAKLRWRCLTHYMKGCKAVIYTVENTVVTAKLDHNH